ncbi:MAG: putative inorganic carbon transporter subunit DabA [Rhodocyclaceae bacterium]
MSGREPIADGGAGRPTEPPAPTQDMARLGRDLKIRSMVTMAGEPIPFLWPIRSFIHHNPLHGLEHLPFEAAVTQGMELFHARGYLGRTDYQGLIREGKIDIEIIESLVADFLADWYRDQAATVDEEELHHLKHVLVTLVTRRDEPTAGQEYPPTEAIMAQLKRLAQAQ